MQQRTRFLSTAIVGLAGAVIGSFSMMLYASTHFAGVAGPGHTPPIVSAAPATSAVATGGDDQSRIVAAVKRVQPSVVALNVVINGTQYVPPDPFNQFFGGGPSGPQIRRFRARASGSGFIYSRNGNSALIVTNAHVVQGASSIQVLFANGDRVPGKPYAVDVGNDIALVKVDNYGKLPPPVELADSSKLEAGQWAIAIGEPLELKQTVTVGVVSGFNRDEQIGGEAGRPREFKGLLQTSAPINPGNSGGPLIDDMGRLIGVNQSTAAPQYAQGIGFAIPVNTMKTVVANLEKNPGVHQGTNTGFIGVQLLAIDNNVRSQLNYHSEGGVAIAGVVTGSAADAAGLEPGDVIQRINGKAVNSPKEVQDIVGAMKPGTRVEMQIWSGGVKKLVFVKVGERPVDTGE